ncbi:MAG: superoxide dismutase family protein [Alphaproteobacteria bacterium]|jgi:Cu-Zn family superoxide dismutase|nr:superoxide dismutase family protein [Alphaproteobacteria bacterium]
MNLRTITLATGLSAALLALSGTGPALAQQANGTVLNPDGATIGTVTLTETPAGVLIATDITGLPPGQHAFHIHAVGSCEPPDFTSAAGHFNPTGARHGLLSPDGPHAGDMPNVSVGPDGVLRVQVLNAMVTLGEGETSLFDADGSSIVMHIGPDDYITDPAGAAGARIACAVIERP